MNDQTFIEKCPFEMMLKSPLLWVDGVDGVDVIVLPILAIMYDFLGMKMLQNSDLRKKIFVNTFQPFLASLATMSL